MFFYLFLLRFLKILSLLVIVGKISYSVCDTQVQYETNIIFYGFASNGSKFTTTFTDNDTLLEFCDPSENYTVVVHGWTESILSLWVAPLVANFNGTRHGCVFFMDY